MEAITAGSSYHPYKPVPKGNYENMEAWTRVPHRQDSGDAQARDCKAGASVPKGAQGSWDYKSVGKTTNCIQLLL